MSSNSHVTIAAAILVYGLMMCGVSECGGLELSWLPADPEAPLPNSRNFRTYREYYFVISFLPPPPPILTNILLLYACMYKTKPFLMCPAAASSHIM